MTSRPETPPSKDPESQSEYRFEANGTACEFGESYHPGGYHPVHIHQVFNDRYSVVRKLGYGSFSTVWLANDLRTCRYVALKIVVAKPEQQQAVSREFLAHDHLVANNAVYGSRHIIRLLDSFNHHGPNGTHLCLVYEVMGPHVKSMTRLSPQCQFGDPWDRRLPKQWAKRVLRDTLRGLQVLHANGIVHGDVHPGNILFAVKLASLTVDPPERLEQYPDHESPLRRRDGKIDPWAPEYLLEPMSLHDYTSLDLNPLVKISDLGGAFFAGSQPSEIVTPPALRAPELVLKDKLGTGLDVWSFGCLIFELATNLTLFHVESLDGDQFDETTNDEHLIQITEIIQPLPEALLKKWSRASSYYGPTGERIDGPGILVDPAQESIDMDFGAGLDEMDQEDGSDHETDSDRQSQASLADSDLRSQPSLASTRRFVTLEKRFRAVKPADIDEEEEKEIVSLMRLALQPDAAIRASAAQLLQHAWFRSD